jgi:hypothetical protein
MQMSGVAGGRLKRRLETTHGAYNDDERVWLEPSKEWAEKQPKPHLQHPVPAPANDLNGAWPYAAAEDVAVDRRTFDPQVFVGK